MNVELQRYLNLKDNLIKIYDYLNNFNNSISDFNRIVSRGYSIDGVSSVNNTISKIVDENQKIMIKINDELLPAIKEKIALLGRGV